MNSSLKLYVHYLLTAWLVVLAVMHGFFLWNYIQAYRSVLTFVPGEMTLSGIINPQSVYPVLALIALLATWWLGIRRHKLWPIYVLLLCSIYPVLLYVVLVLFLSRHVAV